MNKKPKTKPKTKPKRNTTSKAVVSAAILKKAKRVIFCPHGERHIDKGKFAKNPHTQHLCVHEVTVFDAKKGKMVKKKKKEFFTVAEPSIGI